MFLRVCLLATLACGAMWIDSPLTLASSPNSGRDLLSIFRFHKSPVPTNEGQNNGTSAMSHQRLARMHAERQSFDKAHTHFGLALKYATPRQIPGIAADYAAFLVENNDLHRAELVLRQALAQAPHDSEIIRMLARCLVQQGKLMEGLRHFQSIGSEAEAQAEIAAIYREQGNLEMLAVIEKRWGATGSGPINITVTPNHVNSVVALPPIPRLPMLATVAPEMPAVKNQVTLMAVPTPALPTPNATPQPRKHYVIDATASGNL